MYKSISPFLQTNSFVAVHLSSLSFPGSWWVIPVRWTQSSLSCQLSGWLSAHGRKFWDHRQRVAQTEMLLWLSQSAPTVRNGSMVEWATFLVVVLLTASDPSVYTNWFSTLMSFKPTQASPGMWAAKKEKKKTTSKYVNRRYSNPLRPQTAKCYLFKCTIAQTQKRIRVT